MLYQHKICLYKISQIYEFEVFGTPRKCYGRHFFNQINSVREKRIGKQFFPLNIKFQIGEGYFLRKNQKVQKKVKKSNI